MEARMEARLRWKAPALLAGMLALAGGSAALAPGAIAAAPVHKCANKVEVLKIAGAAGEAPQVIKVTIKAISSQGVSCAAAYKFLGLQYSDTTSTPPEGYKCSPGKFKAPVGSVPEVCTKPGAKIQFAGPGG
jgi:hypothetical protein